MALVQKSVVVVIDGANVSRQKDGRTRISKLAAAIEFFRSGLALGGGGRFPVKCVAFVPNFWLNAKPSAIAGQREIDAMAPEDVELLRQLVDRDYVTLTPSQAHDDYYVIDYAVKYNGFIVTNDMFRDHVASGHVFHGKKLTRKWVNVHCIDFTFVGTEFMPNPTAMERVRDFDPTVVPPPDEPSSSSVKTSQQVTSSLTRSLSGENKVTAAGGLSAEDEEDEMDVDIIARRKKNIDLSEVTHYRLPRELLPILHGDEGDTMTKFQEFTDTYIVLPALSAASVEGPTPVVTLSIYGPESNRQRAVQLLDPLLANYQNSQALAYQQQQQLQMQQLQHQHMHPQQQFSHVNYQHPHGGYVHPNAGNPHAVYSAQGLSGHDEQMMDIDPF